MAKIDIILPAMGEGVIEATLTKIMVKTGDSVSEDDVLCEVATDKVDSEITATQDGTIGEILLQEDTVIKIGDTIMFLSDGNEDASEEKLLTASPKKQKVIVEQIAEPEIIQKITDDIDLQDGVTADDVKFKTIDGKFISPLVRSIAKQEGLSPSDLDKIKGTGENGRLTKRDILNYISSDKQAVVKDLVAPKSKTTIPTQKPVIEQNSKNELVKMDRVRKLIADHMMHSIQTSAHVSSFVECDMTNIVNWRNKIKGEFLKNEGEKLTFTPIFVEVVAKALKDFPMINVSIDGDNIIKKRNINIGMAAALPNGNLIVPVIKNADKLSLLGLAKSVNDLAVRARGNSLAPDEIQEGTFTITNFGTFNNIFGTPIINQPQVAILGIGAIKKQVAVIESESGDTIGIRHKMILSLSYDHRVVDGALGGMFLAKIGEYLDNYVPQVYN